MSNAIVIGLSAGGFEALKEFIPLLPASFTVPIIIVQHLGLYSGSFMCEHLNTISAITVKEAEDKEPINRFHAYFAPAGYHLLIEQDRSFSLSVDPKVNYSRPSIDVMFESAVDAFGADMIGVILTGGNKDGAAGLKKIKQASGVTIVQSPHNAQVGTMPRAAIEASKPDYLINLIDLAPLLIRLSSTQGEQYGTAYVR